jgi:hypothetical protein
MCNDSDDPSKQMAASLTCDQQPKKLQDVLATSPEVVSNRSRHRKAGSHQWWDRDPQMRGLGKVVDWMLLRQAT